MTILDITVFVVFVVAQIALVRLAYQTGKLAGQNEELEKQLKK